MRKYGFLIAAAWMIVAAANVHAQESEVTPQQLPGLCPALPRATILASHGAEADEARRNFNDELNKLRRRVELGLEKYKDRGKELAESLAQQVTGHSVGQLQNMNDAQLHSLASNMAAQQLAAAGLGGMSLSDLQALEGKSEEEVMAALMGARTVATAPQQLPTLTTPDPELKRITEHWADLDRQNEDEMREVFARMDDIVAKYKQQQDAVPRYAMASRESHHDGRAMNEQEQAQWDQLEYEKRLACYSQRHELVASMQKRIAAKLPDVARFDELAPRVPGQIIPSIGYIIAEQYLDVTESILYDYDSEITY